MILFELKCSSDHHFEAWFRDGAAYDAQAAAGGITCPECGDTRIAKAPMAPRIARRDAGEEQARATRSAVMRQLAELRQSVEKNCDYVGPRFAEEARKIHYGETDPRGIYGEATPTEAEALNEEGVAFQRVPWLPRANS
jgi:hypothetical protein